MRPSATSTAGIASAILALSIPTAAHTWLEEILRIKDGKLVGPAGYARKYLPRTSPAFVDTDAQHKILVGFGQPIPDSTTMCRTDQTIDAYSNEFQPLRANSGDWLALTYLENGHTTLKVPNKPLNGGIVYVYGTTNPLPPDQEMLNNIHMTWNAAGTGGDGRGRLLATRNYDNGLCHEQNGGPESQARQAATGVEKLPCQTDVQLPNDLPEGKYTLYWVWDWPELVAGVDSSSATGTETLDQRATTEMYTTCLDIEITAGDLEQIPEPLQPAGATMNDADFNQLNNMFQVTKNIEPLVAVNKDRDDPVEDIEPVETTSKQSAEPTKPVETEPVKTEPVKTEPVKTEPTMTESEDMAPTMTESSSGHVVTVTDIVTLSLPEVVTLTVSIGDGTTTTLPIAPTSDAKETTSTIDGPVEPTRFMTMIGAKFRRAHGY